MTSRQAGASNSSSRMLSLSETLQQVVDELDNYEESRQAGKTSPASGPAIGAAIKDPKGTRNARDTMVMKTLKKFAGLRVDEAGGAFASPPGLMFAAMHSVVALIGKLIPHVPHGGSNARDGSSSSSLSRYVQNPASDLVYHALLCLANLLETPPWRHVFFGVLDEDAGKRQEDLRCLALAAGSGGGGGNGNASASRPQHEPARGQVFREFLKKLIVPQIPAGEQHDRAFSSGSNAGHPPALAGALNRAAVRLFSSMVRHRPLCFPASSYAALAPHLAELLINEGRMPIALRGASIASGHGCGHEGSGGPRVEDGSDDEREVHLVVLLDLFAACARGSPHFRQCIKGLRRKRDLFRRLLGFLSQGLAGGIVVRALSGLTRVLAGDPLEGKIFERQNALETASLVMDSLLGVQTSFGSTESSGGRSNCSGTPLDLLEQRRFAEVASDLARSQVFMSVVTEGGRLASFHKAAVAVLRRAAARVLPQVLQEYGSKATALGATSRWAYASRPVDSRMSGTGEQPSPQEQGHPEPLLKALCCFCLDHSHARAGFVRAILDADSGRETREGRGVRAANEATKGIGALAAGGDRVSGDEDEEEKQHDAPYACAALLQLCLHPHTPTAAAASSLVQCLLVGGGALGGVTGPSPDASAAGVGVIPTGFIGRARAGAGKGSEDPLHARFVQAISCAAVTDPCSRLGAHGRKPAARRSRPGVRAGRQGAHPVDWRAGAGSTTDSGSCLESDDRSEDLGVGPSAATAQREDSGLLPPIFVGALRLLIRKLERIGGDLAAALASEQARPLSVGGDSRKRASDPGRGAVSAPFAGREGVAKARAVETAQEVTSILCLLSAMVLAVPVIARALARTLSPEAVLAPILRAQRSVLAGVDPAEYPRAPVEIVLVTLTLIAQLALALGGDENPAEAGIFAEGGRKGGSGNHVVESDDGDTPSRSVRRRMASRRARKDVAGASRLRMFLGEQVAVAEEIKLCIGHAGCRAESKDLARRVASLISLLQAGGGVDALLVADSLYAFAQSAEARETELRSRAGAADATARRERAAATRQAEALQEAEALVATIETRNAEEIRSLSERDAASRRRLQEAHSRALARSEASLRRAATNSTELERALSTKEDALRSAGRELRAKDLEIASLRGDLAGEQRLRGAADAKLEEACSERDKARRGQSEAEALLDRTVVELQEARDERRGMTTDLEHERANVDKARAALLENRQAVEAANARAEEAYGKLVSLAKAYKDMDEKSKAWAEDASVRIADAVSEAKMCKDQAREEERRHRLTKAAVADGEAALQRAEHRLAKVSAQAANAQAGAAAARAAMRDATEHAMSSARESTAAREELARVKAEVEELRSSLVDKDRELAHKCREVGQQAGIIGYINKLSSNAPDASIVSPTRRGTRSANQATVASIPDS